MKANQASKIKNDAAVSRVRRVQLQEKLAQKQKELELEEIKARAEAERKPTAMITDHIVEERLEKARKAKA